MKITRQLEMYFQFQNINIIISSLHIDEFFLDSENKLLSDVEFESLVEDVVTNEFYAHRFKIKK